MTSSLRVSASGLKWSKNKRLQIFVLDPFAGPAGSTYWKCNACRNHAEHKRFATYAAADRNRAHPNCRCGIRSVKVSDAEFYTLFGSLNGKDVQFETRDLRAFHS